MKTKRKIQEGDKIIFVSGNFQGLTATVVKTDWSATNPEAIFGIYHEVLLSDGRTGYIEKSEHFQYLKQ